MGWAAIALVVAVPCALQFLHHWTPVGDDAGLANRAWRSLSPHPGVLGPYSLASAYSSPTASLTTQPIYGLGPLYFWALALPVRFNPTLGFFWGASLLVGASLLLGFEALRSAGLRRLSLLVPLAAAVLTWRTPLVFANLPWNAYLPVVLAIPLVALGVAVASGKVGFWPVQVVLGCLIAQCEFLFLLPAFLVVVASVAMGLRHATGAKRRAVGIGVGAGVLCWSPLLLGWAVTWQNLTRLRAAQARIPTMGWGFGLRLLGRTMWGRPLVLTAAPARPLTAASVAQWGSPLLGFGVLACTVLAMVVGWRLQHRWLGAFAVLLSLLQLSAVFAFAQLPSGFLFIVTFWYLEPLLWLLSFGSVVLVVGLAVVLLQHLGHSAPHRARLQPVATGALATLVGVVLVLGLSTVRHLVPSDQTFLGTTHEGSLARQAAQVIEARVPRGELVFDLRWSRHAASTVTVLTPQYVDQAVLYTLITDGWTPGIHDAFINDFTNWHPVIRKAPVVELAVTGGGVEVVRVATCELTRQYRCRRVG